MMSTKPRPAPGQRLIEYGDRRNNLRLLQVDGHVKHLLRVLHDHAYPGNTTGLAIATIASEMCVNRRTVDRALREAREGGLILVKRRGMGHVSDYSIRWAEIADMVRQQWPAGRCDEQPDEDQMRQRVASDASDQQPAASRDGPQMRQVVATDRTQIRPPVVLDATKPGLSYDKNEPQIRQPVVHQGIEGIEGTNHPPSPASWRDVEGVVVDFGLGDLKVVATARSKGCSAAQVLQLVEACRRHGVGPGCLHRKLCVLRPRDDPEKGWWPPATAEAQQEAIRQKRRIAEADQRDAEAERQEELRAVMAARETQWGYVLDRMGEADVQSLLPPGILLRTYRRAPPIGGRRGQVRGELLRLLEHRETGKKTTLGRATTTQEPEHANTNH